jgi:hypothetical protein
VPFQQSVITAEIERWPETALTRELARHPAFVNRDVFPIIADRLTQKQLFDKLGSPPRRGSCWRIKASGRRCSPAWASWRSLSARRRLRRPRPVASAGKRNRAAAG